MVDIWGWVPTMQDRLHKDGHERLAELMDVLPDLVQDAHVDGLTAIAPEAIALARAAKEPWVELYVRHWLLQGTVLRGYDANALRDAVELISLAHDPAYAACPQAVCVVQDFAAVHGIADGAGYAEDRIAITTETLARINPAWGCFVCISKEHASALRDAGRPVEAVQFLRQQVRRLRQAGDNEPMAAEFVWAHIDAGNFVEAADVVTHHWNDIDSRREVIERDLAWAAIHCGTGDTERALQHFSSFALDELWDFPELWLIAARGRAQLVALGAVAISPTWNTLLSKMVDDAHRRAAVRTAIELAFLLVDAAHAAGDHATAAAALDKACAILPLLAQPLDAPAKITARNALVQVTRRAP